MFIFESRIARFREISAVRCLPFVHTHAVSFFDGSSSPLHADTSPRRRLGTEELTENSVRILASAGIGSISVAADNMRECMRDMRRWGSEVRTEKHEAANLITLL
ncbi:hypothetical protein KP509_16G059100 [Ceratopteris richardii]|uniref:Uncharacterized protein n=1 Tax=Ceratopteris richardii TaxID=49495 RepID=A0A8T2T178_CERRI|nr:hypothetical protein KP509_16G059100 [Ceratopteris richardii]